MRAHVSVSKHMYACVSHAYKTESSDCHCDSEPGLEDLAADLEAPVGESPRKQKKKTAVEAKKSTARAKPVPMHPKRQKGATGTELVESLDKQTRPAKKQKVTEAPMLSGLPPMPVEHKEYALVSGNARIVVSLHDVSSHMA